MVLGTVHYHDKLKAVLEGIYVSLKSSCTYDMHTCRQINDSNQLLYAREI